MAIGLEEYKRRVYKGRLHLVENWCLCKYCELYDSSNPNFEDWAEVLLYAMNDIKSLNVDDGNKLDTLKQMLIEEYDFNDAKTIHRIIVDRFNRERICNDTRTRYVSEQFAESIDDFITALGDNSIIAYKYINEQ
jgi:hypothetical protein